MTGEWKHVTNPVDFPIHEQLVLASTNLPGSQEEVIRNLCSTQILKTQIFVPLFEHHHSFVGVVFSKQRLGDIGPAFEPCEFVFVQIQCPRFSADYDQKKQDRSNLEHARILLLNSKTASL